MKMNIVCDCPTAILVPRFGHDLPEFGYSWTKNR